MDLQKFGCTRGRLQIGFVVQHLCSARERRNHQSIPCRNNLVVQMRTGPVCAIREKLCSRFREESPRLLLGLAKTAGCFGDRMSLD